MHVTECHVHKAGGYPEARRSLLEGAKSCCPDVIT